MSERVPRRIVCLTSETTEIAFSLGAGERVVGVPGYATRPPEAASKARVGGFTSVDVEGVLSLRPDLVLSFSDLQKDAVRDLLGAGVNVLALNQRSLGETLDSIAMIGRAIGAQERAEHLVARMQQEIDTVREQGSSLPRHPRIYFEEWDDPMISGIGWIGEMIEIAGGEDVLSELRTKKSAGQRVVDGDLLVERNPEIILAAWCGKRVDTEVIRSRPGWKKIDAVRRGQIHAVEDELFLSPGPALVDGLKIMHALFRNACTVAG